MHRICSALCASTPSGSLIKPYMPAPVGSKAANKKKCMVDTNQDSARPMPDEFVDPMADRDQRHL
jgi:hypothetical protein